MVPQSKWIVVALLFSLIAANSAGARPAVGTGSDATAKRFSYEAAAKYLYGNQWQKVVGKNGFGGKKASPKKSPVSVGWMSLDGGVASRPGYTKAAEIGAWLVNNVLGGIDGHPLVLNECHLAVEADGQTCAQQFANDSSISLVLQGTAIVGDTSYQQAMAGAKPTFTVNGAPVDVGAPNDWVLFAGRYITGAFLKWLAATHKTHVAYVTGNTPLLVAAFNQVKALAEPLGVSVTPVYYDAAASDITPTIVAANLKQYDYIYVVAPSAGLCVPVSKAFDQLNITSSVPVATTAICADKSNVQSLGDLPKWQFLWNGPNIYAPFKRNGSVAAYIQAGRDTRRIGDINLDPGGGFLAFSEILYAAKLFDHIGVSKISVSSIKNAMASFKAPLLLGPPSEQFGRYAGFPNFGSIGCRIYSYIGRGKWRAAAGGGWLDLNG